MHVLLSLSFVLWCGSSAWADLVVTKTAGRPAVLIETCPGANVAGCRALGELTPRQIKSVRLRLGWMAWARMFTNSLPTPDGVLIPAMLPVTDYVTYFGVRQNLELLMKSESGSFRVDQKQPGADAVVRLFEHYLGRPHPAQMAGVVAK